MNKVAQYLNEHITGEITANRSILDRYSRDGSVLTISPELVMFPRVTNDIRKAARFSWQLAEKGNIIHIALKDKEHVVHVQPGLKLKNLNDTLNWQGLCIPGSPRDDDYSTVGGAVANNSRGLQ